MRPRHEDLPSRIPVAMRELQAVVDGLPARAQANAWWPYHGRAAMSVTAGAPSHSPELHAGEESAAINYRLGVAHLQRALVAAAACHAGVRYRWANRGLAVDELPDRSPAACGRAAGWLLRQLPFLARAVDDDDATDDVLDQLAETCTQIAHAHARFTRAAPEPGRAGPHRPIKPARRRGR
jgi:hypothetical protein